MGRSCLRTLALSTVLGLTLSVLTAPASATHSSALSGTSTAPASGCFSPPTNGSNATVFVLAGTVLNLSGQSMEPPYSLGLPFCLDESVTFVGSWTAPQLTQSMVLFPNSTSFDWPGPFSPVGEHWTYNETLFPGSYDLYFYLWNTTVGTVNVTSSLTFDFNRPTATLQPTGAFVVAPQGNVSWPFTIPESGSRVAFTSEGTVYGSFEAGVLTPAQWQNFEASPSSFDWLAAVWEGGDDGGVIGPILSADLPANTTPGDYVLVVYNPVTSPCTVNFTSPLYLAFTQGGSSSPTYEVSFSAVGPVTGAEWYVNVTGGPSLAGNGGAICTALPNGSYTYADSTLAKYWKGASGSFSVNGAATTVAANLTSLKYTVTYIESGLPSKLLSKVGWTVEVNGTVERSKTSNVSVAGLPNGTYPLLVVGPAGHMTPVHPTQVVAGATTVRVNFMRGPTRSLTFVERGLPRAGRSVQEWCVEVSSWMRCSSNASLIFENLTPGTYGYSVRSPLEGQVITAMVGKTTIGTSGNLTLYGTTSVRLAFTYSYTVTFRQYGLTNGTWSVTVKGVLKGAGWNSSVSFELANGSYGYQIGSVIGYTHAGSPGRADVIGAPTGVAVIFTPRES
jgi:hypothetical protein